MEPKKYLGCEIGFDQINAVLSKREELGKAKSRFSCLCGKISFESQSFPFC